MRIPVTLLIACLAMTMFSCDEGDPEKKLSSISISNAITTEEGQPAVFTVTVEPESSDTVHFSYVTQDVSTTHDDYSFTSLPVAVAIPPGNATMQITIPTVYDALNEGDESFKVVLSGVKNAQLTTAEGECTITNKQAPDMPSISIAKTAVVTEWLELRVTVSLSHASTEEISFSYTTQAGTIDPNLGPQEVVVPAGSTTAEIKMTAPFRFTTDAPATFTIVLSNPKNALLKESTCTVTVLDWQQTYLMTAKVDGQSWPNPPADNWPPGYLEADKTITGLDHDIAIRIVFYHTPSGPKTYNLTNDEFLKDDDHVKVIVATSPYFNNTYGLPGSGQVVITSFDAVNKIMEGTFECTAQSGPGAPLIVVSEGVFKIPLF